MLEVPNIAPGRNGFAGVALEVLVAQLAKRSISKFRRVFEADTAIATCEVVANSTVGERRIEVVDCVMHRQVANCSRDNDLR